MVKLVGICHGVKPFVAGISADYDISFFRSFGIRNSLPWTLLPVIRQRSRQRMPTMRRGKQKTMKQHTAGVSRTSTSMMPAFSPRSTRTAFPSKKPGAATSEYNNRHADAEHFPPPIPPKPALPHKCGIFYLLGRKSHSPCSQMATVVPSGEIASPTPSFGEVVVIEVATPVEGSTFVRWVRMPSSLATTATPCV
jgi:hypothetical protein